MTTPVQLNDNPPVKQRKIRDMLEAWKEELAAVALTKCCDSRLERLLRVGHIREQVMCVLKEHLADS